jgi:hypothetical protein
LTLQGIENLQLRFQPLPIDGMGQLNQLMIHVHKIDQMGGETGRAADHQAIILTYFARFYNLKILFLAI